MTVCMYRDIHTLQPYVNGRSLTCTYKERQPKLYGSKRKKCKETLIKEQEDIMVRTV